MDIDSTSYVSPNHSPRDGMDIDMLVLHATVGRAKDSLEWLVNPQHANPDLRVSTHYLIDKSGKVYQLVPDRLAAWHAGVAEWQGQGHINKRSIGIELENANNGRDPYPAAQIHALLTLSRDLTSKYGILRKNVVRHLDVAPGRKTDPAGFPWKDYLDALFGAAPPSNEMRYIYKAPWYARWKRANVRREPKLKAPIVGHLHHGDTVRGFLETGEKHSGDDRWVRLSVRRGYVWFGNLELVSS